jgi:hypothetical protein
MQFSENVHRTLLPSSSIQVLFLICYCTSYNQSGGVWTKKKSTFIPSPKDSARTLQSYCLTLKRFDTKESYGVSRNVYSRQKTSFQKITLKIKRQTVRKTWFRIINSTQLSDFIPTKFLIQPCVNWWVEDGLQIFLTLYPWIFCRNPTNTCQDIRTPSRKWSLGLL